MALRASLSQEPRVLEFLRSSRAKGLQDEASEFWILVNRQSFDPVVAQGTGRAARVKS